jgi:hypothetical protein
MRSSDGQDARGVPRPFRLTSARTAELREGGGWISLFGLPFFVAGIFLTRNVLRVVFRMVSRDGVPSHGWVFLLFVLMSLVFLGLGGVLLFGRRWVRLDSGSGSAVRSTGLLFPMRSERRRLSEFNAVVMAFEAGDSDTMDRYPVRLRATSGKDFLICSPTMFAESRTQAEFLSGFLRLPLADATTDHEVIVSAERARDSLRERLLRGAGQAQSIAPPPGMRSQVSRSADKTTIVIPRRKSVAAIVLAAAVSCFLLLVVAPSMWRSLARDEFVFAGLIVLLLGILPFAAISLSFGAIRNRTVVTGSPAGIVIEREGTWRAQTTTISADDILDVDCSTVDGMLESARRSAELPLAPGPSAFAALRKLVLTKGIIVKSRQGLVTFGEGLAAEELRFLKSAMTQALAGPTRS